MNVTANDMTVNKMIKNGSTGNLTSAELSAIRIRRNRIRRQHQLHRRMLIAACALFVIMVLAVGFTSFLSKASESTGDDSYKTFDSVMIPYGATLSSISSEYVDYDHYESLDAYVKEVRFVNHLDDDKIIAGHYLIMPYYAEYEK